MSHLPFPSRLLGATLSCIASLPAGAAPATPADATVFVTGNPLGQAQRAQPGSVLSGDALLLRRGGTLGETLDGLPGVAASWFGPNSSRPLIRGLDGERVRLLESGSAAVDASSLSFDHAVAIHPLVVERVEVLRGPAALQFGGNATGGVVNAIDNRIPRAPQAALSGRAELRAGGAAGERAGSAVLEGGAGPWAWHVDGFERATQDLRVPRFSAQPGDAPTTRVRNSAAQAQGGALGAAWTDSDGFVGLSADSYRNHYGVTVEPDATIRMQRERVAFAAERRRLGGVLTQIGVSASQTRYRHQEVEGDGAVGTTFASRGSELRVEAQHAPLGPWRGVIGLHADSLRFSALGEEAFVPDTRSRSQALYLFEEANAGPLLLSAGLRGQSSRVASAGDPAAALTPRFGAALERRFTPVSAAAAALWPLAGGGWTASASLGHTERAPAHFELFANGLHLATAAYERGDPTLGVERSAHADLGLAWAQGPQSFKASVYTTRFSRFISLDATGAVVAVPGEADEPAQALPEYAFRAVRARLQGVEIESRTRLVERPWTLDLTLGLDSVRGRNLDAGEPLPRLAPRRLRAALEAADGPWRAGLALRHAARQDRVPATDQATASNLLADLWLSWQMRWGAGDLLWFVRLDNLGDRLAFNATSVGSLRGLAPLPGRAASTGLRVRF